MHWTQVYDPLGHWWLSTLVAALPIIVLLGLLAGLKVRAHLCAVAGAATAVICAIVVFGMPARLALSSFFYGSAFGLLKIVWIVIAAVFLYDISVETAQFQIMKQSVAAITPDRRLQLLLVPFWLVRAMVSWSEAFEVLPAILVVGGSFAATQWFWANYMDSNLVDIAAGVVSLVATMVFLRVWQPKRIWRFEDERVEDAAKVERNEVAKHYTAGQTAKAWLPFAILSVLVLLWGLPSVKLAMNKATTPAFKVTMPDGKPRSGPAGWDWPYLHGKVFRTAPVVQKATAEAARFDFNWLTATGTGCFIAAILAGLLLGLGPGRLLQIFGRTLVRLRFAIVAMTCMLGLGYITRYSGMDAVLGLAFTRTGWFFPFFGTFIGWLGVALTGSDTSSNVLFGGLQKITAQQLNLSPILMCAANSAGGVMGKMIDAQSICIATAATNQVGNEGSIFRFVFWHSVALAAIVGLIVMLYAYVFQQAIPNGLNFIH